MPLSGRCSSTRSTGTPPDGVLLTGDIAIGYNVTKSVKAIADGVGVPVYFVAGNHDYYGRSIVEVRDELAELTASEPNCQWLPDVGVVELADGVVMGHVPRSP